MIYKIHIGIQNGFEFSCQGKHGCLLSQNLKEAAKHPLPRRLLEAGVCKMEIIVYPLHGQPIGPISTTINKGRLVTSIRRDTTASEPIPTRWASNMGGKTHLIQARPKDLCLSLHFPIHTRWAAKQTRLGRNRCRQIFSIGAGL